MKAVVLARGLARRMRAPQPNARLSEAQASAAVSGLKPMMPVGSTGDSEGRPFLDYILSTLADAGCDQVALIIGPEHDRIQRRYRDDARPTRLVLEFVVQPEPIGTANAVLCAEAWAGHDPFLVVNGDNLYPIDVLRDLSLLHGPGLPVFTRASLIAEGHIPAERIASFALVALDRDGYLAGIVEKPDPRLLASAGASALVSMNCWRFDARIFPACRDVPRSSRGELELPQAVGLAIDRGVRFATVPGRGAVLDLSNQADVAEVSRRLQGVTPRL